MASEWEVAPVSKEDEGWEVSDVNAPITQEELEANMGGRKGVLTPDEESGMFRPSPEQLKNREDTKKGWYDLPAGRREEVWGYTNSGGDLLNRAGAGAKVTPEGKADFIAKTNAEKLPVIRGENDKVYIYKDSIAQYVPWNPEGFDLGDLAEWFGLTPTVATQAAATAVPGGQTVPGQVAAGAVGSLAQQGVSAALPGDDKMTSGERMLMTGQDTAFAGAFKVGANAVVKAFDYLRPRNMIARQYEKVKDTPNAKAGRELLGRMESRTGRKHQLSIAEETQDPWLMAVERNAANSFAGKPMAINFYNSEIKDAFKYTTEVIEDISRNTSKSPEVFGNEVKTKFKAAVDKAYNARRLQADQDYAFFNGNKTEVPMSRFVATIDDLSNNYSSLRTTLKKGIQIGKNLVKLGGPGNDMTTISKLADHRTILANVARGKGNLFTGLDPSSERHIAKELMKAIDEDLVNASDYVPDAKLKDLLDKANKNYFNNSELIRGMKGSVLGRILKTDQLKAGENITNVLLNAKPSELKAIMEISGFEEPVFKQGLKEQYALAFLRSGKLGAKNLAPGMTPFNPKTAIDSVIGDKRGNFKIIFENGRERAAALDAVRFNQRLAQNIPSPVPRSGPEEKMVEALRLPGGSVATFGPAFIAKWYTGPVAAKLMFNREGQDALRHIVHSHPTSKAYIAAAAYITQQTMSAPSEEETVQHLPKLK